MAKGNITGPILSEYFDHHTVIKLQERWLRKHLSGPEFWSGSANFWSDNLQADFKINQEDFILISGDQRNIYVKLYRLAGIKTGALLQAHTKFFLEKMGINATLLSVADDNLELFKRLVNTAKYDRNALKELQIIASFFASQNILGYLHKEHGFTIDSDVLNMAILSGAFVGEALRGFTVACTPTFDSIRYGIKSRNVALVQELFEHYKLKPTSDHLVTAAATGKIEMFDLLTKVGVVPRGQFVLKAAEASNSPEIIDTLVRHFGYTLSSQPTAAAFS